MALLDIAPAMHSCMQLGSSATMVSRLAWVSLASLRLSYGMCVACRAMLHRGEDCWTPKYTLKGAL